VCYDCELIAAAFSVRLGPVNEMAMAQLNWGYQFWGARVAGMTWPGVTGQLRAIRLSGHKDVFKIFDRRSQKSSSSHPKDIVITLSLIRNRK